MPVKDTKTGLLLFSNLTAFSFDVDAYTSPLENDKTAFELYIAFVISVIPDILLILG